MKASLKAIETESRKRTESGLLAWAGIRFEPLIYTSDGLEIYSCQSYWLGCISKHAPIILVSFAPSDRL
jgi:hypothetical protein